MANSKSIIPPTGDHGLAWPDKFVLPQGKEGAISYGGWTKDNEGFVQQTFLGASTYSRRRIITLLLAAPRTCLIAQHT